MRMGESSSGAAGTLITREERAASIVRCDHPGKGEQPVDQDDRDEAGIEQECDDEDRGEDVTSAAGWCEGSVGRPQHQRQ